MQWRSSAPVRSKAAEAAVPALLVGAPILQWVAVQELKVEILCLEGGLDVWHRKFHNLSTFLHLAEIGCQEIGHCIQGRLNKICFLIF